MAETTYTYSIADDFPDDTVNTSQLVVEIQASAIVTALEQVDTSGDSVDIIFKDALSSGDKTILDNDEASPAGGLIAAHDNATAPSHVHAEIINTPHVHSAKYATGEGGAARIYAITHNWCDKTTWWYSSVQVINEAVGTGDGSVDVFNLDHDHVIDLEHGKFTDEDDIPDYEDYLLVVKVDGVEQTKRSSFETSGGDYVIDYAEGTLTFADPPPDGDAITASYWYSPTTAGNSVMEFIIPAGKIWCVCASEMQFSKDVIMNDTLTFGAYIGETLVGPKTRHKTIGAFLDLSYGSFSVIPAIGGSARGMAQDTVLLRVDYHTMDVLPGDLGVVLKAWAEGDNEFGGERATATLYIIEKDAP